MTDQEQARIRLAKAMGYHELELTPDPFTDANDDYAVLEWMRRSDDKRFTVGHGPYGYQCTYQIGDYARAALKVLEQ